MKKDVQGGRIPRRGGRPSQSEANQIGDRILDIATEMFLSHGYGSSSIEAIAKRIGISKRTFYHRFNDKADLFRAVVHRLLQRLRPAHITPLFTGGTLEEILLRLSKVILHAALTPEAVALHRLITNETVQFPELAAIMETEGSRQEAIGHISKLLKHHGHVHNPSFAAEMFLQMIVSVPQRRALGLGISMSAKELDAWIDNVVLLFLKGYLAAQS